MIEFVTDRTQHHVERLKKLQSIGYENLSESQREEYRGYAAKGAYNYTDLNRVESAVAEIASMFDSTSIKTKTDWNLWDIPTQEDMERYLSNVRVLRNACSLYSSDTVFPPLPDSMDRLTYQYANNIERVLELCYEIMQGREKPPGILGKGALGKMILGKEL